MIRPACFILILQGFYPSCAAGTQKDAAGRAKAVQDCEKVLQGDRNFSRARKKLAGTQKMPQDWKLPCRTVIS